MTAARAGLRQTAAAKIYGVSLRAVNKWVAIDKVGGLRALKPKRRGRRLGEGGQLRVAQAQRIRGLIVGKLPDQLKLPFYLWTRAAIASLIARECGIAVSRVTVGRYLRAWGLRPQKPVRRAYERNEAAVTRWLKQEYPAIARQARRDKAAIYWGDEMGLRVAKILEVPFRIGTFIADVRQIRLSRIEAIFTNLAQRQTTRRSRAFFRFNPTRDSLDHGGESVRASPPWPSRRSHRQCDIRPV